MVTVARLTLIVLLLSGLDVVGAIALKEAQTRHSPGLALLGVACFVSVAALLYVALNEASLTVVSLAWIILYQLTVMAVDIVCYGVVPSRVQAGAIAVALVALAVAAVAGAQPAPEPGRHAMTPQERQDHLAVAARPPAPPTNPIPLIRLAAPGRATGTAKDAGDDAAAAVAALPRMRPPSDRLTAPTPPIRHRARR